MKDENVSLILKKILENYNLRIKNIGLEKEREMKIRKKDIRISISILLIVLGFSTLINIYRYTVAKERFPNLTLKEFYWNYAR